MFKIEGRRWWEGSCWFFSSSIGEKKKKESRDGLCRDPQHASGLHAVTIVMYRVQKEF